MILSHPVMRKCGTLFTNHYGFAAPHGKGPFITAIIAKNAFSQLSNIVKFGTFKISRY